MNTALKSNIAGMIFALLVGFTFFSIKICVPLASPLQILTFRYDFAFLGLLLLLVLKFAKIDFHQKKKKPLFISTSFYVLFMIFQTIGLCFSTSIEGAIIFAVTPIIVQILAVFILNEHTTKGQLLCILLSVAALIYLLVSSTSSLQFNALGTAFLFLSSLNMAFFTIAIRYYRLNYSPTETAFAICLEGFIFLNLVSLGMGLYTHTLSSYFLPLQNPTFVVAIFYLGIACILITSHLIAYMLHYLPATNVAIFNNVSTAISIVVGVLALQESLEIYHIIGTVVILFSVIGMNRFALRE